MANESITITFETLDSALGSISIELDDERNEEANAGRTSSFIFGDEVFFRVYPSSTESALIVEQSDGIVTPYGKKASSQTDILNFTEPSSGDVADNTASLSFSCYGNFTSTPIGNPQCGAVYLSLDNETVKAASAGIGVYSVTYDVFYHLYSLRKDVMPTGWDKNEPYPILVVVTETFNG